MGLNATFELDPDVPPLVNAYLRISKGTITGGTGGWSCTVEVYPNKERSEDVSVPKTVADIPEMQRIDPSSGKRYDDETLEAVARELPPTIIEHKPPLHTFNFGPVEWVEGEDPHVTLYREIAASNTGAKEN